MFFATNKFRAFVLLVLKETWRGKTLARIFLNRALQDKTVTGSILDLGSGRESASYERFLQYAQPYEVLKTDFFKTGPGVARVNLEEPLPFTTAQFDWVTTFNALEHVFKYQALLTETRRITKPGGGILGGTPFLVNVHPDPHDFFRYTNETLHRILQEAGYVDIVVTSLGMGPLSVAVSYLSVIMPRPLRVFVVIPCIVIDWLLLKVKPQLAERYALGYLWTARVKL